MFRFAQLEYLFLLLIVPVLWLLFIYARIRTKKNLKKFGRISVLFSLMPDVSSISHLLNLPYSLWRLSY